MNDIFLLPAVDPSPPVIFVDKGNGFEMVGVTAVLGAVAGTLLLLLGVLDRLGLLDSSGALFFSANSIAEARAAFVASLVKSYVTK